MIIPAPRPDWELHPQLERDTVTIGDLPLSRVLLIRDANYLWLLLVPRRQGAGEITDLDGVEQAQLMTEISHASHAVKSLSGCDKINVAALGNVVPQLHVHIIARGPGDAAWPRPVWNAAPPRDYETVELNTIINSLTKRLTLTPL